MNSPAATTSISLAQGLYYLLTGLWPLVSMRTFLRLLGPKTDLWLVKTVGALLAVVGAVLALAGWRGRTSAEVGLLATGSAATLAVIDVMYVARGRIWATYLLDAAVEAAFLVAWTRASWHTGPPE